MFENFTGKWTFSVQQFFWGQQTISKVAITKTKSATIAFSFFHLFFSFVTVILELIVPKKPAFWHLLLKSLQCPFEKIG